MNIMIAVFFCCRIWFVIIRFIDIFKNSSFSSFISFREARLSHGDVAEFIKAFVVWAILCIIRGRNILCLFGGLCEKLPYFLMNLYL